MPALNVTHQTGDWFQLRVRGHELLCDQPPADGGTDQGPTPTELFVASLAACACCFPSRWRSTAAGACWRSSTTAPSTTPSAPHPRYTSPVAEPAVSPAPSATADA